MNNPISTPASVAGRGPDAGPDAGADAVDNARDDVNPPTGGVELVLDPQEQRVVRLFRDAGFAPELRFESVA